MKRLWWIAAGVLVLTGCSLHTVEDSRKGVSLSMDKRIELKSDTISIYEEGAMPWMQMRSRGLRCKKVDNIKGADSASYIIVRVATILPVTVEGKTVQANDIMITGNKAYIAYNYAGDLFAGAIQILDISKPDIPAIIDELKFATADINALYIDGNDVLFGGQGDPEVWDFKSFVGVVNSKEIIIDNIINSMVGLSSHSTTGICKHGNNYYAGVGAENGNIEVLDKNLHPTDSIVLNDVRDVESYQSGLISLAGTTDDNSQNGSIVIIKANDIHNPAAIPVVNFGSDYHKATIEVYDGTTALLGLSLAGFQVIDLKSNLNIYQLENPPVVNGIPTNTNSVSSDGNLIFTANGGYGFRLLRPDNKSFQSVVKIGFYHPNVETTQEQGYSANHIAFKSNYLIVASGIAGVHIYSLKKKS